VVYDHLAGKILAGVYPLLPDHTCWFLACDFDREGWELDVREYLATSARWKVPAYLERSRSGKGGHIWTFFSAPVPATSARQLGMSLLRETMLARAEMDLASYDRFFPNQDFMPKGGFGNLIALPLQKRARSLGNSAFVDSNLNPWPDQWAFLSEIQRLSPTQVEGMVELLPPVSVGMESLETLLKPRPDEPPAPEQIRVTIESRVSVEKSGLPPSLLSGMKHMASLHNPEFYQKQKIRLSTFRTPRFIKCYEEDLTHLHLPRGLIVPLKKMLQTAGSRPEVADARPRPEKLDLQFQGTLTSIQEEAVRALSHHELGVLEAPPGIGKTVIACAMMAERNVPTLVLAHRKPLLDQWRVQMMNTLGLKRKEIGQIGAGRKRRTKTIDLGMIQSIKATGGIEEILAPYAMLIVDECHHIPAFSFENVVKRSPARYVLGLTATPYRRDGLKEIITMQCGPIRHRISSQQGGDSLTLRLLTHETEFEYLTDDDTNIQEVFRALVQDQDRSKRICQDALKALGEGRRCLVLSEWREHCGILAEEMKRLGKEPYILDGNLKKRERDRIFEEIRGMPSGKDLLVIATGNYIGEGFDCPQVDTLFLAFPIAFRGSVVQYVGRIQRQWPGKHEVRVYDYADLGVPMLRSMHGKRLRAFENLGFPVGVEDLFF
jgi:superfamily II DNA or RNA helicase